MTMPPRRPVSALALATVLALAAAIPLQPASANPSAPTPEPKPGNSQAVTLITGDVVEVTEAGAGKRAATVRPADGREHIAFQTIEVDGGLRVLPSDVVPLLSAGVLDADLFDVEELIADGFGDQTATSLPLIVRYSGARSQALAGTTTTKPLDSIGGAAISASKTSLRGLWQTLAPTGQMTTLAGSGIDKIWLDGKVEAVLDRSVAQIGAPAVWQSGFQGEGVKVAVLDTGIDANHPDVSGKVEQSRDFSGSTDISDHFGHGTHVAATIAGTGAGSNGLRKGVAPKAGLLIGKVLGDDGYGQESWIIEGMEWAAGQGAAVVNMSLGGSATDGTDPMSAAVDRLTASSGTLFVISAGNEGADGTIGTPGAARSALTVGAVDRDESLADFSSRGPRVGDEGLKPEITAPGVDIVAARAAGTAMGTPIDALYTAASGTSMAAPHVAGAAVLLKNAHPDWSATRLKDALVSTAKSNPALSVYAQGVGRADVAKALAQQVYATSVADFALLDGESPLERTVTYTNDTTSAVTLQLKVEVQNLTSRQPETDGITAPGSITVPAKGSVDVQVAVDPTKIARGLHSGWLVATGTNGVVAKTAVGALRQGPTHQVTVRAIGADGTPTGVPTFSLFGENPRSDMLWWLPDGGSRTFNVEEGTYFVQGLIDIPGVQREAAGLYVDPSLKVDRDMEVVLDARKAVPIRIQTPKPSEQQAVLSYYTHRELGNGRTISHGVMHFSTVSEVRVTPTAPVTEGRFEFSSRWQLVAPLVQASVKGLPNPLPDMKLLHRSPSFEGTRRFPLVAATPTDLSRVRGAVAVLDPGEDWEESKFVEAVANAGGLGVILLRPLDRLPWTVWRPTGDREPIPAMVTTQATGQQLIAKGKQAGAKIDLTLTTSSPYLYDVQQVSTGQVPAQIVHKVTPENSMRITTGYADNGGFGWAKEQRFGWRPWQTYSWNDKQRYIQTPKVREEWVSTGDSLWQHRVHHAFTWDEMGPLNGGMTEAPRSYRPGTSGETWFGPVVRPASPRGVPGLVSARSGDLLKLRVAEFVDKAGHYSLGADSSAKLWRNGQLLAELPDARQDITTSGGDASYRLELSTQRDDEEWTLGTSTKTVWDFRSARQPVDKATPLSLLQVDYDVPVGLDGKATSLPHVVRFGLRHQDGHAAPRGTSLKAEISTDQGTTWRRAVVVGQLALIPSGHGTVSLRVTASDGAGNRVEQTVVNAYNRR
ncbi:S8 family serine peptidase [Kribbella sp. NBC_01245]|uniref:S8 family serine peptidase n=1 Tax=Kribbella sp. NBC_01245 TaxID=2903578 RepID=UPI002E2B86D0|nr:S8 family serine peptidase [Kribbella sp. NBC_01245]